MCPDLEPPPDDRIAHYKLVREIGRGGQGVVYLAEDTTLHRRVALKVLQWLSGLTEDSVARFRREAAAASRLDHPGICAVYEAALDGRVPYIAMRYVEGESLAAKIASARRGSASTHTSCVHFEDTIEPAPLEADPSPIPSGRTTRAEIMRIVSLIEQIARALHVAHEAGVIHRDMKPANVMVTPDGEPVVMDFGLAHLEDEQLPTLTRTGDFFGTPAYMSPEQLLAQRVRLDRRTDVWSLGVMLYECVTLRRPFDAHTREGLYQAINQKSPIDPRRLNHSVPDELRVVIETALEKDRDRRYATALDLAEELRRVRASEHILAKPASWATRLRRWAKQNPAIATGLAGIVAALVISIVLLIQVASERNQKKSALIEKSVALDDYDRLGDASRLEKLTIEAGKLWPCVPPLAQAMKSWVERGSKLKDRLPGHQAVLARLRSHGVAVAPESRDARSGPTDSSPAQGWQFADPAEQFKHDTTSKLVADLTAFVDPDPHKGLLADVCARLAFAGTVEHETLAKYESKWADAIRSIADPIECPKYGGLSIKPQLGLIPIGRDPKSELWEFVHLQTTAPGADPVPKRGPDAKLLVTGDTGIVFVLLPRGTFRMGATKEPADEDTPMIAPNVDPEAEDDEGPVTEVRMDPFFLSKYEMTQGQWRRLVGTNPSQYGPGANLGGKVVGLSNPVEQVGWEDCDSWLGRLGLLLPTEAQWEYGARGGTTAPRWTGFGNEGLEKAANVADNFCKENGGLSAWRYEAWNDGYTVHAPVGMFAANPFGLHDVLGNVWEWCRDWKGIYDVKPRPGDGLRNPPGTRNRVYRGGSWNRGASHARSAVRSNNAPDVRYDSLGVRPARAVDP